MLLLTHIIPSCIICFILSIFGFMLYYIMADKNATEGQSIIAISVITCIMSISIFVYDLIKRSQYNYKKSIVLILFMWILEVIMYIVILIVIEQNRKYIYSIPEAGTQELIHNIENNVDNIIKFNLNLFQKLSNFQNSYKCLQNAVSCSKNFNTIKDFAISNDIITISNISNKPTQNIKSTKSNRTAIALYTIMIFLLIFLIIAIFLSSKKIIGTAGLANINVFVQFVISICGLIFYKSIINKNNTVDSLAGMAGITLAVSILSGFWYNITDNWESNTLLLIGLNNIPLIIIFSLMTYIFATNKNIINLEGNLLSQDEALKIIREKLDKKITEHKSLYNRALELSQRFRDNNNQAMLDEAISLGIVTETLITERTKDNIITKIIFGFSIGFMVLFILSLAAEIFVKLNGYEID